MVFRIKLCLGIHVSGLYPDVPRQGEAGAREQIFPATHWSLVLRAKDDSVAALNSLFGQYRSALIEWLRCRGEQEADDLVHGFFEQMLRREDLKRVAQESGRFRTFLLTAFQNYLRDQHRRRKAGKRGGGRSPASLDESSEGGGRLLDPASPGVTPDMAYDRAWAQAVLTKALERLESECAASGHGGLCTALEPVLFRDSDALSYQRMAKELGMREGAVKMAAHRIRKRLRGLIREEVSQTITNVEDLDAELKYLQGLFNHPAHPM